METATREMKAATESLRHYIHRVQELSQQPFLDEEKARREMKGTTASLRPHIRSVEEVYRMMARAEAMNKTNSHRPVLLEASQREQSQIALQNQQPQEAQVFA